MTISNIFALLIEIFEIEVELRTINEKRNKYKMFIKRNDNYKLIRLQRSYIF